MMKQRSRFIGSVVNLRNDCAEVELTQGKTAIVDLEDADRVRPYNWYYSSSTGYAYSYKAGTSMQQFLVGKAPSGKTIDHVDRYKLNNRRNNLIFKTQSEQNRNTERSDNGGVSYHKISMKFQSYLTINYKMIYLGVYETEKIARDQRAVAMEFAAACNFDPAAFKLQWKAYKTPVKQGRKVGSKNTVFFRGAKER